MKAAIRIFMLAGLSALSVASASERLSAGEHQTNQACVDLIKEGEDLRLESYSDAARNWYIGYGHKKGVTEGMTITEAEAEELLRKDLVVFEAEIARMVDVPVSNGEFSAMVCLAFNIGTGNFSNSTVRKMINQEKRQEAADAILMWNKAGGKVNAHQQRRREAEREIFLSD